MAPIPKPRPRALEKMAEKRAKKRAWLEAQRLVWLRDDCYCRSCKRHVRRHVEPTANRGEVHHIKPRSLTHDISTNNLCLLCLLCHGLRHAGRLTISGDGDKRLTFTNQEGNTWHG